MKRSIFSLFISAAVLAGFWLVPHSLLQIDLEIATHTPAATGIIENTSTPFPTGTPGTPEASVEIQPERDPLGELYFLLTGFETPQRLVRLPGACVVSKYACPAPEKVTPPFALADLSLPLLWAPDGSLALAATHAPDDLSQGKTAAELEQMAQAGRSSFKVSPAVLYLYEPGRESWRELLRLEDKFISSPSWSPDGSRIAFTVRNSPWAMHPPLAGDGLYVIGADGQGLQALLNQPATALGWIGNSIVIMNSQESKSFPAPYRVELLKLDGEVSTLFASSRPAGYLLAPDGGSLLASDMHVAGQATPQKAIDLLALDGSTQRQVGIYGNHNASIWPAAWAPDGSALAFGNLRKMFVSQNGGEVLQVYEADDTYVEPYISAAAFSPDSKHLLLDVYDGIPHFVSIDLTTGVQTRLEWVGEDKDEQPGYFSWRP